MKKSILFTLLLSLLVHSQALAHGGRTDANGGHNCSQKSQAKGLCSGYHYHNGGSSSSSNGSSTWDSSSNDSWDKDCSDFSSYDEVVEYWNANGYSATYDPERLDGWGNTVDDGIPCEAPGGYDLSKINGSYEQIWQVEMESEMAKGEEEGYQAGLAAGQKGNAQDSSTEGTDSYQAGYKSGFDIGYTEGYEQFQNLKQEAADEGYQLGKKQDQLVVPQEYQSIRVAKSSFEEGFNKAVSERIERKKKEYEKQGYTDGKADTLTEPQNEKDVFIAAYHEGFQKGQEELKTLFLKQGFEAAFTNTIYTAPSLNSEKYIKWYKEGFDSNEKAKEIAEEAYQAGLKGEDYILPFNHSQAEPIYAHHYGIGAKERKQKYLWIGGSAGLVLLGWFGRRLYLSRKRFR